jgi:hypothetical protein
MLKILEVSCSTIKLIRASINKYLKIYLLKLKTSTSLI